MTAWPMQRILVDAMVTPCSLSECNQVCCIKSCAVLPYTVDTHTSYWARMESLHAPAFGHSSRLLCSSCCCSKMFLPSKAHHHPIPLSVFTQTSMLGGKERVRRGCQLSRLTSYISHEGSCFGNLKCPTPGGQKASDTIKNQDQITRGRV